MENELLCIVTLPDRFDINGWDKWEVYGNKEQGVTGISRLCPKRIHNSSDWNAREAEEILGIEWQHIAHTLAIMKG